MQSLESLALPSDAVLARIEERLAALATKPQGVSERNWLIFLSVQNGCTLTVTARRFGITYQRVQQITAKVRDRLERGPTAPPPVPMYRLAYQEFPGLNVTEAQNLYRLGYRRDTVNRASDAELRERAYMTWAGIERVRQLFGDGSIQ